MDKPPLDLKKYLLTVETQVPLNHFHSLLTEALPDGGLGHHLCYYFSHGLWCYTSYMHLSQADALRADPTIKLVEYPSIRSTGPCYNVTARQST